MIDRFERRLSGTDHAVHWTWWFLYRFSFIEVWKWNLRKSVLSKFRSVSGRKSRFEISCGEIHTTVKFYGNSNMSNYYVFMRLLIAICLNEYAKNSWWTTYLFTWHLGHSLFKLMAIINTTENHRWVKNFQKFERFNKSIRRTSRAQRWTISLKPNKNASTGKIKMP